MTRYSIFAAACVVAAQCVGCGNNDQPAAMGGAGGSASSADTGGAMNMTGTTPRTALELTAGLSDAEMLNVIQVISAGEVRQGNIAETKAQSADVRAFASKMVTDHTIVGYSAASLANTMGITPSSSEVATMVTRAGEVVMQAMNATPKSADFDRTYVQVELDEQRNVLAVLDRMLENADSDPVRTFLATARDGVQRDLDEAVRVQATLG